MGNGFVSAVYRGRAFWSAAVLSVIVLSNVSNYVPFPNDLVGFVLSFLPFPLLLTTILAFVDRSILVAIASDFFHRGILRWQAMRKPAYALYALSFLGFVMAASLLPNNENAPTTGDPALLFVAFYQFFVVFPGILVYAAAALVIGARRTPDNVLKSNIRFLAFALAAFIISFAIGAATSDAAPFDLVDDALSFVATYMLYRSVMSLSTIGKMEKIA
jgi:hypothetical protein